MRFLLAVAMTTLVAVAACKKSPSNVVARLEQMTSQVERLPDAGATWQPAKVGNTFVIGSAVRTGSKSQAKLRVGKNGKLDVTENAVVYFTRNPARERNDVRVETGSVELETGDESVGIGEAVLDPHTQARVEASPNGTTLVVMAGRAMLEDNVIAAGESITVGPAGHAVANKAAEARDAGTGPVPAGQLSATVANKSARVKTAQGERELGVGEHRIEQGATLNVPSGSKLELTGEQGRAVTHGPSELRTGDDTTFVHLGTGTFGIHAAGSGDTIAAVPGGKIIVPRGSDAAVNVGKETMIDALEGDVVVETAQGKQTIAKGRSASLGTKGELMLLPAPPERTVVTITAGEAAMLHDVKAPTPVRIAFGPCAHAGVVELAKDRTFKKLVARSSGAAAGNLLVPAGSFSYRVRCADGTVTLGTLRVDKDTGRAPLPKTAARTTVEMDGREYTILYQNLLPEVTLAWRNAPKKAGYTFVVKPARGTEKRIKSAAASTKLVAGELREGSYKVWAEPDGGGSRSEESRIVIEFDNAAASASLDSVDVAGTAVRIKGTVIESSTVSANGTPVALDRHRRFETSLSPGEREDGVSLRIAHPKGGIHYYVMRTGQP